MAKLLPTKKKKGEKTGTTDMEAGYHGYLAFLVEAYHSAEKRGNSPSIPAPAYRAKFCCGNGTPGRVGGGGGGKKKRRKITQRPQTEGCFQNLMDFVCSFLFFFFFFFLKTWLY